MNNGGRQTKPGVHVRQIVFFLILPVLLTILSIVKSVTFPAVRNLEQIDHLYHLDIAYSKRFPRNFQRNANKNYTASVKTDIHPSISGKQSGKEDAIHQHFKSNNYHHGGAIPICFITSQFSASREKTDHLFDVVKTAPLLHSSSLYNFFAFSNLPDLNAPGWNIIVKDLHHYNRWITQSRWPKFLGFTHPTIQESCTVVFYIDGILSPRDDLEIFQIEARKILESDVQLAQRLHPYGGGAEAEFERITQKKKDLKKNVQASLQWLRERSDYDKNCTLYENSMFGYAINSSAFRKTASFFWDHYSKEEDSWRDQPLWCYALDHFNITPLVLTGNGKGTLFDQVDSRTAKGSHKYRSESAVSAADYYQSLKHMVSLSDACWLDANPLATNNTEKPTEIDRYDFLTPLCPDNYRRSMAPMNGKSDGLTISIPYFAEPALLLQHLTNFASYPKEVQEKLNVIVVDNDSPSGLRAMDYLNVTIDTIQNASNRISDNRNLGIADSIYFSLKIVRVNHKIPWNEEGAHNLAFYLSTTEKALILDLRMMVPLKTIQDALLWETSRSNDNEAPKAHKFNRRRENGKVEFQQTCAVIDIQDYWNSGGMDEDFAGHYGYGTSPHFWYQWESGGRYVQKHDDAFLLEKNTDSCDSTWLRSRTNDCRKALSLMEYPSKDGKVNRQLWRQKRKGSVKWVNAYMRFNWTVDFP